MRPGHSVHFGGSERSGLVLERLKDGGPLRRAPEATLAQPFDESVRHGHRD